MTSSPGGDKFDYRPVRRFLPALPLAENCYHAAIRRRASASFCDGLTRRDFLHAGSLSALGLTLPGFLAAQGRRRRQGHATSTASCSFLVGGPSQIDTWDPKPNAPAEVRGPFKPIDTNVPGMQISEIFPKMAQHADKFSLIRSRLPHGHGGPRHRPPDDADRPAVHRRHRASARRLRARLSQGPARRGAGPRAAAAADRPHRRQPAARPDAPATSASSTIRSSSTPTRPTRTSRCPTCCRRTTSRPSAPSRRQKMRDAVDGALAAFEKQRPGQAARRQFQPGLSPDVQPAGARGVRPGQGAGRRCATATAGRASARAACWPGG